MSLNDVQETMFLHQMESLRISQLSILQSAKDLSLSAHPAGLYWDNLNQAMQNKSLWFLKYSVLWKPILIQNAQIG